MEERMPSVRDCQADFNGGVGASGVSGAVLASVEVVSVGDSVAAVMVVVMAVIAV